MVMLSYFVYLLFFLSDCLMRDELKELCRVLNYTFQDEFLLRQAITHASKDIGYSYERLEFLGDAVLELMVSTFLFHQYPQYNEGQLTAARTKIVREEYLATWAKAHKLGDFLILGKGEENSGGREKNSILCDVVESIIGALYLDGGFEAVRRLIVEIISFCQNKPIVTLDAKSELQELLQKSPNQNISYKVIKQEGPPHNVTFFVDLYVNDIKQGQGIGKSKKQAEQEAAKQALQKMRKKNDL